MQDDARLFLQMKNSINSDIVGLLSHCEFVKELMDYLDFLYSGKGNVSRMYDVWNAFHCPEKGAKSSLHILWTSRSRVLRTENVSSSQQPMFLLQKEKMQKCKKGWPYQKNCRKLQNRNRRIQTANVATSDTATFSDSSNKIVTMTAEEFSKYSQYQDALKASTPVSALAESGKTCLVSSSNKWIIDSGATDHMTGNHKTFSTFRTHSAPPVTVADGSTYEIKGSGTDLMTKRTFGKGHVSDGLYILDEWVPRPVACVSTASPVEAHCRLGHPSLPVLKKLCPQFDTLPSLDCESCHFAKHHRSSLGPRLNKRAESLFELVHSDVWGPCPVTSQLEVFSHFCAFSAEIKTQYDVSVKILRSDNGKEYVSNSFQNYMSHNGILHQTSCVDTPSQNGVAERKNRHLLETARALMFQMKVPKQFWADAVSTACFLINRMPTVVLKVVNSRPTVGQSSVVDSDASLAPSGPVVHIPPAPAKPPIVQVYSRRPVTTDTCPAPAPSSSDPSSDLDLPISLRKGKRHCKSIYSIANFVSYDHLSSSSSVLVASIDSISVPKTVTEALNHPGWKNAMLEEICALEDNHTWKLVDLPQGKKVVGCKWVFAVKVNPDGSVARLKARLVARGYAQTYGVDYSDTFSPVAKLNSVRLFISIAASQQWMIHQLDIKNAFLHGDLEEEVYLEQPPGFVAQGDKEIQAFGMNKSEKDHSVFYKKSAAGIILLVVYVDDIVITGNDHAGISDLKTFMHSKFHTKDLGELKYFLGIEVSRSKKGMFLSQRKYVLDLLKETDDGDPFYNPERYRRVVGKLNYLTVTRPDIAYAVSVVSQFTSAPTIKHWAALEQILCYLKKAPGLGILYSSQGHTRIECFSDADWAGSKFDRRSTTGYCVFFGGNLVAWKMGMKCTMPVKLWCDNQAALHIAANPVYHERTKHIEVDCHFIREKIEENLVSTGYVKTGEQLGDIFTKALNGTRVEYFCNKLGMINIYAPA
ncbi:Retrovirus-related Pol polyprotein from transposon RE1 [Vitis vinifera]|uniref:Retrovirus-related Pol polyprotein from transposon RE1 n=1 Tax=Vitis vinifera TaxID=29760 RepID=A0A438CR71_VITVI|nr:Retrovirus-related Pol polyprotein from transposon RE1 [Vitis vinifera]